MYLEKEITYPFLERIPLGSRVIEDLVLQGHAHFSKEVVAAEHIRVPDREP